MRGAVDKARRGSLRTQLIVWNSVALMLLFGALGLVTRWTARSFLIDAIDNEMAARIRNQHPPPRFPPFGPGQGGPPHGFPGGFFPGPPDGFPSDGMPPPAGIPQTRRGRWRYGPPLAGSLDLFHPRHYDLDGRSEQPNDTGPLWDAHAFALTKRGGQTVYSNVVVDDEPLRVLTAPSHLMNGQRGIVQTAYSLAGTHLALQGLDRALLVLIPFGLLGAGASGTFLTARVLRRVRRLTQAAAGIGAQRLEQRLPITGHDEFSELAATFNAMLERLEAAFQQQERALEQQRRFTADASHELKTPLTIIRGTASRVLANTREGEMSRYAMQEIDGAANQMTGLVQDLLLLARSDAGQLGSGRIELLVCEVLEQAIARVVRPEFAPVALQIEDETLSLLANEDELTRLFANLLDNAGRYTPPNGCITVTARRVDGQAVIAVTDTGMGIAPEHLARLGERFYRVESARSRQEGGTGLGLSIATGIVAAHGGEIAFASRMGSGTTVTVRLPAVAP